MKKVSFIYKITKIVIDITLLLGIMTCLLVPYLVDFWTTKLNYTVISELKLNIIIISSGVVALYIVWELRKILKNVLEDSPFTENTVENLRHIAISTFIIAIIYAIKLILNFTMGTVVLVIAFLIVTLLFLTLKDLFKQALFYKEENDVVI